MTCATTKDEEYVIAELQRLAGCWPKSLWIYAGDGSDLYVMKTGPNGEQMEKPTGGVDPDFIVGTIKIPNDGGGW